MIWLQWPNMINNSIGTIDEVNIPIKRYLNEDIIIWPPVILLVKFRLLIKTK